MHMLFSHIDLACTDLQVLTGGLSDPLVVVRIPDGPVERAGGGARPASAGAESADALLAAGYLHATCRTPVQTAGATTHVQAAAKRLALAMLTHRRLSADASAVTIGDVVELVGSHIIGQGLCFSEGTSGSVHYTAEDSTIATHTGDLYKVANAVCKDHRMLSGTHISRFGLLHGRGAFIGICDADCECTINPRFQLRSPGTSDRLLVSGEVNGEEVRPHFSSKGWGYSALSGAMFHRRKTAGAHPPLIRRELTSEREHSE